MLDPVEVTVVHVPDESRYDARLLRDEASGRTIGMLRYVLDDDIGIISIPTTVVVPEHRRHGVASALTRTALDDARERGFLVRPSCWYVDGWMRRHPQYEDLRWRDPSSGASMAP